MNGLFTSFKIEELRKLLSETEAGKQPSNEDLANIVTITLRKQYDEEND